MSESDGLRDTLVGRVVTKLVGGWDRFWFATCAPHTLAVIRICCGGMLLYVHAIWTSMLPDFMGPNAWIDRETVRQLHRQDFAWSWLWYVDGAGWLWAHQLVAMTASACMMVGAFTRLAIPLAWWMTLMVCHRMTLALFGLDQIVVMLTAYLMISRCGSIWSLDAWFRRRLGGRWWLPDEGPSMGNRIATRLIQVHLCVIYVFGGLSKMRGEMWFDGSALWYTVVNYEYQSLDLTWLGHSRLAIATLTAVTLFWETYYVALVWSKWTRPIALAMALLVHGGIAVGLGMITFGFIMLVANFAFIEPSTTRAIVARVGRIGRDR